MDEKNTKQDLGYHEIYRLYKLEEYAAAISWSSSYSVKIKIEMTSYISAQNRASDRATERQTVLIKYF